MVGFLVLFCIIALFGGAWFVVQSRPLTPNELDRLARARRRSRIRGFYRFSSSRVEADRAFKASMQAEGRLHEVSYEVGSALAMIASHLKGKKHEWMVFAFVQEQRVVAIWCNKGPDGNSVGPKVPTGELIAIANRTQAHTVIRLHNHPNQYGKGVSLLRPSAQDLISSDHFAQQFVGSGLNFIDVVCDRGFWAVFGERYLDSWLPDYPDRAELAAENGTSRMMQLQLRGELSQLEAVRSHG